MKVITILSYLDSGQSLPRTDHPVHIYLTCAQVLSFAGNARAADMLAVGFELTMKRAGRITDNSDRRSYLANVPWLREITELWEARKEERTGKHSLAIVR
jgi:hypothetical protein